VFDHDPLPRPLLFTPLLAPKPSQAPSFPGSFELRLPSREDLADARLNAKGHPDSHKGARNHPGTYGSQPAL
jgi:hypothetical protein